MALFFDAEWFNARLAERLLSHDALAAVSGMSAADLALVFKDQRELSAAEIALHAGVSTPTLGDAGVETRVAELEARVARLEALVGRQPSAPE